MSISEAKAKLSELVRRAEAGEDVFLMRDGEIVVRLKPEKHKDGFKIGLLSHLGPLKSPSAFMDGAEGFEQDTGPDPADKTFRKP